MIDYKNDVYETGEMQRKQAFRLFFVWARRLGTECLNGGTFWIAFGRGEGWGSEIIYKACFMIEFRGFLGIKVQLNVFYR